MSMIVPQTFEFKQMVESTYKVFGDFMTDDGIPGIFYTSTWEAYHESLAEADTMFGLWLPDFNNTISFHYVYWTDILDCMPSNPGDHIQDACGTECDPDSCGGNYDPEHTSIYDYRSCCVKTIKFKTCELFNGIPYGNSPTVAISKYGNYVDDGYGGQVWDPTALDGEECGAGTLLLVANDTDSDGQLDTIAMWQLHPSTHAGAWPWETLFNPDSGYLHASGKPDVAAHAGYDSVPAGVVQSGQNNAWDEYKLTVFPNYTYRSGDSYCGPDPGVGTSDFCSGYDYGGSYGFFSLQPSGFLDQIFRPPVESYPEGTILSVTDSELDGVNDYGNTCYKYYGNLTTYSGRSGEWQTTSCVVHGENATDVGIDFQIPQGTGQGAGTFYSGNNDGSGMVTFIPETGLKIMKSYDDWFTRTISVYYLASDGRYETISDSPMHGVYELNRKDETLKLLGITKSESCIIDSVEELDTSGAQACVDAGGIYYPEGKEIITMDETGFTDGVMTGTIENTHYSTYYDGTWQTDETYIGKVKSFPIMLDSAILLEAGYSGACTSGEGRDSMVHLYPQLDSMTFTRYDEDGNYETLAGSGPFWGLGNNTVLAGQIGTDSSDNCGLTCTEDNPGDAFGWGSFRRFWGYGWHHSFANGDWDPDNLEDYDWEHYEIGFRTKGSSGLNFADNTNPSVETLLPANNPGFEYFDPINGPCDNTAGNMCGFSGFGTIIDSVWDIDSTLCLFDEAICEGEGCFGCTDPAADNYNPNALYNNFSCEYSTQPGGHDFQMCDANVDGVANVLDIVTAINFILGAIDLSQEGINNMDVNGDEVMNILDVVTCVNFILGSRLVGNPVVTGAERKLLIRIKALLSSGSADDTLKLQKAANVFSRHGYKPIQPEITRMSRFKLKEPNAQEKFKALLKRRGKI